MYARERAAARKPSAPGLYTPRRASKTIGVIERDDAYYEPAEQWEMLVRRSSSRPERFCLLELLIGDWFRLQEAPTALVTEFTPLDRVALYLTQNIVLVSS